MWQSIEIRFAGDHPTADGHFSGNPIIPGALLLDEVVRLMVGAADDNGTTVIRAAKFFQPVRPGERISVRWHPIDEGAASFECHLPGPDGLAASGIVEIRRQAQ